MGFLVPLLMCAVFLIVWIALCRFLFSAYVISMKRAFFRSISLDKNSMAALLSLYFGSKSLFRRRWFPKRSSFGTVYEEIPCILILGRKIFVLEICPYPGTIHNTRESSWRIYPPEEYGKKEIYVQNPVWLAKERAEVLKDIFRVLKKLPFEISVESMAILTDKRYTLTNVAEEGLYTPPEAITRLSEYSVKTKKSKKKMKQERALILALLEHFSLSRSRAVARNDKMRRQKK